MLVIGLDQYSANMAGRMIGISMARVGGGG